MLPRRPPRPRRLANDETHAGAPVGGNRQTHATRLHCDAEIRTGPQVLVFRVQQQDFFTADPIGGLLLQESFLQHQLLLCAGL